MNCFVCDCRATWTRACSFRVTRTCDQVNISPGKWDTRMISVFKTSYIQWTANPQINTPVLPKLSNGRPFSQNYLQDYLWPIVVNVCVILVSCGQLSHWQSYHIFSFISLIGYTRGHKLKQATESRLVARTVNYYMFVHLFLLLLKVLCSTDFCLLKQIYYA